MSESIWFRAGVIVGKTVAPILDGAGRVAQGGFNVYVAANMLLASIMFFGLSKPRETISGFVGRRGLLGSTFCLWIGLQIDKMYRNDPAHCGSTAIMEDEARFALYPRADRDTNPRAMWDNR